ncbi:MAG TPA: tol-pal system-associated acyl-CoA thioesterase [Alphaproteobacteria bacterium]|nr:tol-pal system-associated acyl-CoA thioesterase [Alphaproteobacteria bacterium]HNS44679.1 tol-pal system-associated acyl-CoA thioesterase [Alphaproteobacteria bacterium]
MLVHDFPVRIYYDDTDAGGVVYHANYLKFCERARTEYLRTLGFENSGLRAENGIIIVVKKIEAEYLAPARLDDVLTIRSRVISIKNTSFVMEQKAVKEGKENFVMNVLLVCTSEDLRPAKIPDAVKEIFLKEMEQNA